MPSLLQLAAALLGLLGLALALALALWPQLRSPAAWLERWVFPDANQLNFKHAGKAFAGGAPANVLRILAFGDSLTEGHTEGGSAFHPYAQRLGDLLYPQLPQGWHLEVEEQGESGDRVLIGMKHRLQRTLDEHAAAGRRYDWVLLLGGINDVGGDDCSASEVLAGLDTLVQACLAHGANVLLMTLLQVGDMDARAEAARAELNRLIRAYAAERRWARGAAANAGAPATHAAASGSSSSSSSSSSSGSRLELFDLEPRLPYHGLSLEARFELWQDDVHLTMQGYNRLGELIAEALAPQISLGASEAPPGAGAPGAAAAAGAAVKKAD